MSMEVDLCQWGYICVNGGRSVSMEVDLCQWR